MAKPKRKRGKRYVRAAVYGFYRALHGGFSSHLTGRETLGEQRQKFAIMVARELGCKTIPTFTVKTTLDEAVACFNDLRAA